MLPVLFGGTCDWKWKKQLTNNVSETEERQRDIPTGFSQPFTFDFHFLNHELSPFLLRTCNISTVEGRLATSSHCMVTVRPRLKVGWG